MSQLSRIPSNSRGDLSQVGTMRRRRCTSSRLGRIERFSAGKPGTFCASSRLWREEALLWVGRPNKTAGRRFAFLSSSSKSGPCSVRTLPSRDVVQSLTRFASPDTSISPKTGRCSARNAHRPVFGERLSPAATISPKTGRCAAHPAQRPGFGELGPFEQRIRAILAQRPGFGEVRARKVTALESRREGPNRLPAKTPDLLPVPNAAPLPRRDLAQA